MATIIAPANGATNVGTNSLFSWNTATNAEAYWLYIGSAQGLKDVYSSGSVSPQVTSETVTGLQPNTTYYIRLWTQLNGLYTGNFIDTTFTTGAGSPAASQLTFPANGSTNVDPYVTAAWTTISGAQSYALNVGTTLGASDVFSSGAVTATSLLIPGLLQNKTYYVQLSTTTSQGSASSNSSFTTGLGMAHLTAPTPGGAGVDPFAAFQWTSVTGVQAYQLYVGTAAGLSDVFYSGQVSSTSISVYGLLGGQTYFVKLWTELNGSWYSNSTSFTTAVQSIPPDPNAFRTNVQQLTGSVRLQTQGMTNTPTSGTLLAQVVAADGRTQAVSTEFAKTLVQLLMGQRISVRIRNSVFDTTETQVTTEYWDPFLAKWIVADPTFGIIFWNSSTLTGMSMTDISAAVAGQSWNSIPVFYATPNGAAYGLNYFMDPVLLYLNPQPTATNGNILTNSPAPYFLTHTNADVGQAGWWVFQFVNLTDTVTLKSPGQTLILGAQNGTNYSRATSLGAGWSITTQNTGMQLLTINRYVFVNAVAASLTAPLNGAVNVNPASSFTWNSVSGALSYTLQIGTSQGASNVFNSGAIAATSTTVPGLQVSTLYYARLTTQTSGGSAFVDSTFTTQGATSQLTFPANGAVNVDPYVTATWTSVSGAQSYTLNVGNTLGASDVFSSGAVTATSLLIPGLLQNKTYYVQLVTTSSSGSTSSSSSFTTGLGLSHITAPASGATGVDPFAVFQWTSVSGVQAYQLYVGTASGLADVFNSGQVNTTSISVYGLIGGQTYFIKLWTLINGSWFANITSFTTAVQSLPPNANTFRTSVQQATGNVRLMTQGTSNTPTAGTLLAQVVAADGRTQAFSTEYAKALVQLLMGQRISVRIRSTVFDTTETQVTTEYWDPFLAKWIVADPSFGVVFWNSSTQTGMSVGEISAAVVSQAWSNIPVLTVTANGTVYGLNYYIDPILLYLNPQPTGTSGTAMPNSPAPYFTTHTNADIGQAAWWVFQFASQSDSATVLSAGQSISLTPQGGTSYGRATSLASSWSFTSLPAGLQLLTINRYVFVNVVSANLTAPSNGATNVDQFAPFTWNSIAGALSYTLQVGTSQGASNIFNSGAITATSVAVSGLQTSTLYYARLTTTTSGGSAFVDSTFTTGTGLAHLITPANGAVNVTPSSTFSWNAVSGATSYRVYIGTSVGAQDIYSLPATSATSAVMHNLGTNTLYYARMWTQKSGSWFSVDSTFTTGNGTATLTAPTNGQSNFDPWQPFAWTTIANTQSYTLWVGTTVGASNIYNSGPLSVTTQTVPGLSQNTTYFVRLFTTSSLGTTSVDTTFTTGLGKAHMISPASGATNVDPYQAFTWNAVPGAQAYYVNVGTTATVFDIFNSGQLSSSITSRIVSGMLGGQTYYVKLWTLLNGSWFAITTSFTTASQPNPPDASAFRTAIQQATGAVRLMTQGVTNTPTAGTALATVVAQDGRTTAQCVQYARTLAERLIGQRIATRVRSLTFDGTAYEAHVTTEYFDPFLQKWIVADPTFGVVYWNPSTLAGLGVNDIASIVVAQQWTTLQPYVLYTTANNGIYGHNYYMDPILLYLNPITTGSSVATLPLPNSPAGFMTTLTASVIGTKGNYLFSFSNSTDSVTISNPGTGSATYGPQGGTIYSQALSLTTGWSITSSPSGMQILTMNRYFYF